MSKIRLTKEFTFEMAHALWNYDGLCKNIHGHSYRLQVTILGTPVIDQKSSKLGMIMDFKDLKAIVKTRILNRFDHAVVINKRAPHEFIQNVKQMFDIIEIMDYQPTCENLIADFAKIIKNELPSGIELHSLRLYETTSSYAEWYQSDNQ